jgi:hypothetical protein
MPHVTIYGVPLSAPTRIVMMTCEVLGVRYELINTNPLTGDTRTEEYIKVAFSFFLSFFILSFFIIGLDSNKFS